MPNEKLKCPKCVGILEEKEFGREEGAPILVDVCWACSGMWFDDGELKKALGLKNKIEDVAPTWSDPANIDFKKEHVKCPRCEVELIPVKTAIDRRLVKERCPKCFGTWLDGGELGALERGGTIQRLWTAFQEARQERESNNRGNQGSGNGGGFSSRIGQRIVLIIGLGLLLKIVSFFVGIFAHRK
jgi:Zn-finger nucleic acid-binding protein